MRSRKIWIAATFVLPLAAQAGMKSGSPVTVNSASRYAYGITGTARNSVDYYQNIGCYADVGASGSYGGCYARNAQGQYVACYINTEELLATARSVGLATYLYFQWDLNGKCTRLYLQNDSSNEVERP